MARGTVVNEPVVSQASTEEFRSGYDRTFGDRKPVRGRWIWDARQQKLVDASEYVPESRAIDGTIMVDRFMEGERTPDGVDIGSRQKRKRYMQENGLADYDDFKGARERRAKEQAAKARGEYKPDPELRNIIGRELYKQKVIL